MAINRFFKSGMSDYTSQYVPHKLPFELWQQNLNKVDERIDSAKTQHAGLYTNEIAGIDEAKLGEYGKQYYSQDGTLSKFISNPTSLTIGDRKQSEASVNNINTKLDAILTDDFLMKAASGDIANELININKEVLQHKANNEVYKKREEAVQGIYKTVASNKDWESDPTLLMQQERELQLMNSNPTYIPKDVGVGKYFDPSNYVLDQINRKKDSGGKSYDHSDPLYVKWNSSSGVSGAEYAMFVKDIWDDENSPLRANAERKVNELIQSGHYTEQDRNKLLEYELDTVIETSKNLQHRTSDTGERYKSGEERKAIDDSKIIEGTGEVNEFSPPQSLNQVNQAVSSLSTQWNTLSKELTGLKYGSPEWNKKNMELKNVENQLYQYKAGAILGEMEIQNKYDPGGIKNISLQTKEVDVYLNNNPQLLEQVLVKNADGSYIVDYAKFTGTLRSSGLINEKNELTTLGKNSGLTESLITDFGTILTQEVSKGDVETKINRYKENNVALEVYNSFGTGKSKKEVLVSLGIDVTGKSDSEVNDIFQQYNAKGKTIYDNNKATVEQREKYNTDLENERNAPVNISKYDYYTTTTGVRTISNQELGFVNADLDITNSKIVLADGTIITDPVLLKNISNSIYATGDGITGAVSGNGRVKVSTNVSKWSLMTEDEKKLELSKADIDIDDPKAYAAWQKSLEDTIVTVDAYLQGGTNTSKTISNNTVNQVLNDPNKTNEEKTSFVTGLTNEQTFKDLNGETSKLIVSYSEGKVVTGAGTSSETNEDEFFVQPNKTINIQMVNGSTYESVPVNVSRVEMNNDYGTPQLVYTFSINGQELKSTPLPSEDSQAFTDYVTALIYSTQN